MRHNEILWDAMRYYESINDRTKHQQSHYCNSMASNAYFHSCRKDPTTNFHILFSMISILDLYSTGIFHCFGKPWEAPCTGSQGQAHGSWPCVVSAAASPLVLRYRPFLPWLKSWFIPGSDDIEVPWMPWPWRAWLTWITWFGWSQLPRYPADPWPWFGWSNHGIHFIVVR